LDSSEKGTGTVFERAKNRFWVKLARKNWLTTLEAEAWINWSESSKK
jgi:hypothetical protein